jgi:hypothetical protein
MKLLPISDAPTDRPILGYFPDKKPSHQWAVIRWHPDYERFYLVHGGAFLGYPAQFAELSVNPINLVPSPA